MFFYSLLLLSQTQIPEYLPRRYACSPPLYFPLHLPNVWYRLYRSPIISLPALSSPSFITFLTSPGVTSNTAFTPLSSASRTPLGTPTSICSRTYAISTRYICLPAALFATSVAASSAPPWCAPRHGAHRRLADERHEPVVRRRVLLPGVVRGVGPAERGGGPGPSAGVVGVEEEGAEEGLHRRDEEVEVALEAEPILLEDRLDDLQRCL